MTPSKQTFTGSSTLSKIRMGYLHPRNHTSRPEANNWKSASWFQVLRTWPKPVAIATILVTLSAMLWLIFSFGFFASLGMPFFEAVGLPMQAGIIAFGLFLMLRLMKNRPDSAIRSVPIPVRVIVPIVILLGALQLSKMSEMLPAISPAGNSVSSFNASVDNGICTAIYNGAERVPQSLNFCATYQSNFNKIFAGAWLLFSALELWGAWAIFGAAPAHRVLPDRQESGSVARSIGRQQSEWVSRLRMPYVWLLVRLAILAYWVIAGYRGLPQNFPIPGFVLIVAFLWGVIATRYWIAQAYTNSKRTEPWLLPSWFVSPFQGSQPFQFFHLGGLSFVAFGIAALAREVMSGRHFPYANLPVEMFGGAFGLGILLGIYWTIAAYRSRFQRVATPGFGR
jgi:hypothetical protein